MKSRTIGIIAWALGLVLSLVLLFCLASKINATVILTCVFTLIAFVGMLIFLLSIGKRIDSADETFLHIPAFIVAIIYMVIQIPICIIFALLAETIPTGISILINVIILIVAWLLVLTSIAGNDYIRKVNSRQKDHHTEL